MLEQLVPIAGVVLALWVAWTLIQKLMRRDGLQPRGGSHLHLKAYCTHCNWEGRVDPAHPICGGCGGNHVSVTAT